MRVAKSRSDARARRDRGHKLEGVSSSRDERVCCHVISYHILSRVTSHRIILYYITSCHVMSCLVVAPAGVPAVTKHSFATSTILSPAAP